MTQINESNPIKRLGSKAENRDAKVIASLLIQMNGFLSIEDAEHLTTLDKTTQYRERKKGRFPTPVEITGSGRRKAYRIKDLIDWLKNPGDGYQS